MLVIKDENEEIKSKTELIFRKCLNRFGKNRYVGKPLSKSYPNINSKKTNDTILQKCSSKGTLNSSLNHTVFYQYILQYRTQTSVLILGA